MVSKVKISSRNQIVIPAEVRHQLSIGPGDSLLVSAGRTLISIMPVTEKIEKHPVELRDRTDLGECVVGGFGVASIVKVSSRNQIVVPSAIRKKFGIGPGNRLLISVWDQCITVIPEPESYAQALRGLHKEIWEDIDTDEYIKQERAAWES